MSFLFIVGKSQIEDLLSTFGIVKLSWVVFEPTCSWWWCEPIPSCDGGNGGNGIPIGGGPGGGIGALSKNCGGGGGGGGGGGNDGCCHWACCSLCCSQESANALQSTTENKTINKW